MAVFEDSDHAGFHYSLAKSGEKLINRRPSQILEEILNYRTDFTGLYRTFPDFASPSNPDLDTLRSIGSFIDTASGTVWIPNNPGRKTFLKNVNPLDCGRWSNCIAILDAVRSAASQFPVRSRSLVETEVKQWLCTKSRRMHTS